VDGELVEEARGDEWCTGPSRAAAPASGSSPVDDPADGDEIELEVEG
jgi:hypothetical protein